jgi:hypothetical protein
MRATLNDQVVAESDDVEVGASYKYFPASATRLHLLRKVTEDRGRPRLSAHTQCPEARMDESWPTRCDGGRR